MLEWITLAVSSAGGAGVWIGKLIASRISAADERVRQLEAERHDCEEQLRREIRRGAELALMPRRAEDPPPDSLPPPNWEENTDVRVMRAAEESSVIAREKQSWARHTGRVKMRSRPPVEGPPMHVLIIEDDAAQADAIHRLLDGMVPIGWEVQHTTDAVEGRALLVLDSRIRVAFVDYSMPKLDGLAVIEEALQHRPELRGRIVLITGVDLSSDHYVEERRKLFDECKCLSLAKPFDSRTLEQKLWEAIQLP